ncbi:SEC-C metal-binding domain-containing protein [Streptomyces sp. NPDC050856]|uniref:SEC-C metal-binding domain-containing protein n=1 Tax=Streptomyces sp. NPDC050856 TaxID=3154939 RepID=UPI0033FDE9E9
MEPAGRRRVCALPAGGGGGAVHGGAEAHRGVGRLQTGRPPHHRVARGVHGPPELRRPAPAVRDARRTGAGQAPEGAEHPCDDVPGQAGQAHPGVRCRRRLRVALRRRPPQLRVLHHLHRCPGRRPGAVPPVRAVRPSPAAADRVPPPRPDAHGRAEGRRPRRPGLGPAPAGPRRRALGAGRPRADDGDRRVAAAGLPARPPGPGAHAPCPCGSGRKFKRCVHRWGRPGRMPTSP